MTPQIIVLDSSVVVKWIRQEESFAAEALQWFTAMMEGAVQVAAPSLLAFEVANALNHKDDFTASDVQQAISNIYALGFDWYEPNLPLISRAIELARVYRVALYDATFVALAEALGADLITADEKAARNLALLPYVKLLGRG
jgi:predicted nucleic acid-binding protein